MKKYWILISFILISFPVVGSEISNTKITRIMMDQSYGEIMFIQVEGAPARDSGHCHVNGTWDFAISTQSEFGKQMLSQLLVAYSAQKNIQLVGSDLCTNHSSAEDLRRIELF